MMPKDYEAAAKQIAAHHGAIGESTGRDIALEVARACYALHCKPQRELTDAEIDQVCIKVNSYFVDPANYRKAYKELLEAHQRKQQEPETVKFRAARRKDTGRVDMLRADFELSDWEWLPGEPQEYEVTLP